MGMTRCLIVTPNCPRCGEPPVMAMSVAQAFCGNTACAVLSWDMRDTVAEHYAMAETVDLSGWVGPPDDQ